MSRIDARGKLAQAVSDAPGRDISGAPTCDQLGRLLQALRAGVSGRQFAAQEQERRETSDVHWQGQALSHDFFSSAVHVIAEWLRRKWRAAWRVGTSACVSYDGQRQYEDLAFVVGEKDGLTITRGLLGICDAHEGMSDLDVPKSERVCQQVNNEVVHFCTPQNGNAHFKYRAATNEDDAKQVDTIVGFLAADRANDAQRTGQLLCIFVFLKCKHVGPDHGHELLVFLRNA